MNLVKELIYVLEEAKSTNEYYNPVILKGVLDAIYDGCPNAENEISDEINEWVVNMWSR